MWASRRIGLEGMLACWLACALPASAVHAQAGADPAQPAPGSAPAASVAPIAPVSATAPGAQPVPALPSPPAQPTAPAAAPTAVPAAPPAEQPADQPADQKEEKPSPSEPSETPPTEPGTTSTGASATLATDAEILLVDSPTEASDDEKEELPWSARVEWGQSYNAGGLTRGGEQTNNPEYVWDFLVALGYKLDKLTRLSLRQPLSVELTDSDTTNTRQELWLLDTTLDATRDLWLHKLKQGGGAFALVGGLGLVFPVSPSSQAAHLILGTRAKVGFGYSKKNVLHGLGAGTSFAYLRRWASSNQVNTDTPYACRINSDDIADNCSHLGGLSTRRDVLLLEVHGDVRPLAQLAVNASFSLGWNRGHDLADSDVTTSTGNVVHLEDQSTTHWRNTREIALSVAYDFTDWFSASASATNSFRERGPDGELRAPFHATDIAFGLTLSLSIDQLYLAQRGRGTASD
jgi:hypothetical protein